MSDIDLSPILNPLIEIAGTALLAAGTWAMKFVIQHFKLKVSQQTQDLFDQALTKSITSGVQLAKGQIAELGWDHADVQNTVLATALSSITAKFPDALKGVGLDPDDPADQQKIMDALTRMFPQAAAVAAASPATPPVAAPAAQTNAEAAEDGLAAKPGPTEPAAPAIIKP